MRSLEAQCTTLMNDLTIIKLSYHLRESNPELYFFNQ